MSLKKDIVTAERLVLFEKAPIVPISTTGVSANNAVVILMLKKLQYVKLTKS